MKVSTTGVGVAAACSLGVSAALRADVVAANNIPDDWSPSSFRGDIGFSAPPTFPNTAEAQYFLADVSGDVTSITSTIRQGFGGPTGAPLHMAIHEANGAVGSAVPGAVIGAIDVAAEQFPPFDMVTLVTIDFSAAGVHLEAGHGYMLVLSTDTPVPGGSQYSTAWMNTSGLNFGQAPNFSPDAGATWRTPAPFPNETGVRVMVASGTPCPADWNGDATVNSQDFFDFLGDFFAGNADFNHDDVTNSQDFFDYLTAFFAGC
jgi:hypothetical protein